jgi:hypothetical protein
MLIKKGDSYVVSGSWFTEDNCHGGHENLKKLRIEGGSDTFTIFEIESKFEVNENSYPEFIEGGAKMVIHPRTELETTSSYLDSFILMMYPSMSTSHPSGSFIPTIDRVSNPRVPEYAHYNGFKLYNTGSYQEFQIIVDNN